MSLDISNMSYSPYSLVVSTIPEGQVCTLLSSSQPLPHEDPIDATGLALPCAVPPRFPVQVCTRRTGFDPMMAAGFLARRTGCGGSRRRFSLGLGAYSRLGHDACARFGRNLQPYAAMQGIKDHDTAVTTHRLTPTLTDHRTLAAGPSDLKRRDVRNRHNLAINKTT